MADGSQPPASERRGDPADPWAAGRERTAAEVREIFARARPRDLGAREQRFHPLPGLTRLPGLGLRRLSARGRVVAAALAAALLAGFALGWPALQDARRRAQARERQATAAHRRAEVRRLIADQRPRTGRVGREAEGGMVSGVEALITADAQARVAAGRLEGPIRRTVCDAGAGLVGAHGRGASRILRCLAVTSSPASPALIGHEFIVRVAPDRRRATWCKNNSPPAHPQTGDALAVALAAPLAAACTRP